MTTHSNDTATRVNLLTSDRLVRAAHERSHMRMILEANVCVNVRALAMRRFDSLPVHSLALPLPLPSPPSFVIPFRIRALTKGIGYRRITRTKVGRTHVRLDNLRRRILELLELERLLSFTRRPAAQHSIVNQPVRLVGPPGGC